VLDYFAKNGAPCPPDANPAEHIVEVIQGNAKQNIDWVDVWNRSEERQRVITELEELNNASRADTEEESEESQSEYATSHWFQFCMVLKRIMTQLWRSPVRILLELGVSISCKGIADRLQDYMWNKVILHIFAALFSGFTFWKMGNSSFDLQLRLFAIFNFIFVAPGCINQMQPFFLHNRDIFETREKKVLTEHLKTPKNNILISAVQNVPLDSIYRGTGCLGNSLFDPLCHSLLPLLVLHGWVPKRI
jgi:hypothetical protein